MQKRTPLIALGATVAAAGAAALSPLGTDLRPAPAGAQSSSATTTATTPARPAQRERQPLGTQEKRAEQELAKALGKSTEEVHAARRGVLEDRLKAQRDAGRITTEQGEVILRAFDLYVPTGGPGGPGIGGGGPWAGGGPQGGPGPRGARPGGDRGGRRGERREQRRDEQEQALAKALGVSVGDLRSARAEVLDARLAEAEKAGRITAAQRKAAVEAARTGEAPAHGTFGPGPWARPGGGPDGSDPRGRGEEGGAPGGAEDRGSDG